MAFVRTAVALITLVLLTGGYAASQLAFFNGSTAQYIAALDASPVPMLSLGLLVTLVILAFVKDEASVATDSDQSEQGATE
jgi:preprotein translocase subunit SecG